MRSVLRIVSLTIGLLVLLSVGGCEAPPQGGGTVNNTANNNSNNNSAPLPSSASSNASAPNQTAITLPVLDAFFADQSFAGELKSRLQLTDEQVAELRRISQESRESLRETDDDRDYQGSTAAARQRATSQIESIIGREKMEQLFAFVHERWGGNGAAASMLASTPGSVPQDTRVVVNAPAFRMDVFNNGQLVQSYKVGIGYPEFPLPTGLRHADTIIFNPTWTPPDEPWVESPGSNVKVGETVKAGDKLNPLGLAKIPIGLPSLIHGGKSPSRIGNFASHGCVGLTDKQLIDFAKELAQIGGATLTDAQIAQYRKNRSKTQDVKLSSPVPVELRYETITVEDGKLHIYRDVYDRNTNTEENLRAVLQAYGVSFDQLSEAERSQALAALKQMSRDVATGKPDTQEPTANSNSTNRNSSGRVTRNIKGQKEMVIQIAALQGKGYPAPVGIE
ncbi:MAG TPA: L,D-transpeptidase family protein [Blastocatellia bacterium]|nr:L,D-transpeptidase family protein [Blastocatellia bacterium]